MEKKQRILLVHNYYKIPGGEDTVVANEKKLLEDHGHEVFLYSRSNTEMESFSIVQKLLLPFTSLFSLRTFCEVKKEIRLHKIDIVHVHNTLSLISPSVYYAAFVCGKPVVQTVHNFRLLCPAATFLREGKICEECVEKGLGCAVRYGCYRGSRLQTLVSASILKLHRILGTYRRLYYICLTDFNRNKLLLLNKKGKEYIKENRVFAKPNFAQTPPKMEVEKKEQYIYVGRLEELKGIHILIEAWEAFPDKTLLLCGGGPKEEWVRSYLKNHHMKQVKLLGQVEHQQVLELIAESHALILPTCWYEGQPMVITESYSVGTPVIVSDIGNAGSMVEEGKTGLKFRCGSAQALREAVCQMEKKTEWETGDIFAERYSAEKSYELLQKIYSSVERGDR